MVADGLVVALKRNNFTINRVADGATALAFMTAEPPDIIILDLGLPDIDGIELLGRVRKKWSALPVLVLTARDSLEQKVAGLDVGADDYLTKPFELPELLARLRVQERRLNLSGSALIQIGNVIMDTAANTVTVGGTLLDLSKREYMLVKALMEGSAKIHTRESLRSKLYNWDEQVASNAIDVHVHNLRKKLPANFIDTVRGIGYTVKK